MTVALPSQNSSPEVKEASGDGAGCSHGHKHMHFQETNGVTRQPAVEVIVQLSIYGASRRSGIKRGNTVKYSSSPGTMRSALTTDKGEQEMAPTQN